jgi:hypothetical protein
MLEKKLILIDNSNREELGKVYLRKASQFAIAKSFGKSYEFFKEGLDIVSCDCLRSDKGWLSDYLKSDKRLFKEINIQHVPSYEYLFVKAFMLSYEEGEMELYLALDAIDNYLEFIQDEYGHYLRGRIMIGLNKPEDALKSFYFARRFSDSARLQYRIGRTKEQFLSSNGLGELFNSFMLNPSSICCCRLLKKYSKSRGITLKFDKGIQNPLVASFLSDEPEWKFQVYFEDLVSLSSFPPGTFSEMSPQKQVVRQFISILENSRHLFINEPNAFADDQASVDSSNYHDDYGNSYEKYGGYNGWSDDVIDDAFEGDPENTWNVD